MSTLSVRLAKKTQETANIASFEFVSLDGADLPAFEAGAHVDFHLAGGLVRSYSIYTDAKDKQRYGFGVLLETQSKGGSQAMHALQVGAVVSISAPKNLFPLVQATEHLLLAGGIGITPILSMAQQLTRQGQVFALHYAARSKSTAAFLDLLANSGFAAQVHHHFDDGAPEQQLNLAAVLAQPQAGKHLYVCGPQGLIDAALRQAEQLGWAKENVHYELFGAQVVQLEGDQSFSVVLQSTGQTLEVPADKTVIQVLHAAGIDVPIACEQGVCGTCLTRVLSGVPDHRDMYLTPEEQAANDQFTPCCSRSKTASLVLDL